MRVYETTETTSLLNYERESNKRSKWLCISVVSVVGAVVLIFLVFHIHTDSDSLLARSINLLGSTSRRSKNNAALSSLNSKPSKGVVPPGCESTVMIIRHCEKDGPLISDSNSDEHCSYLGFQRAQFLTTLFTGDRRWPIPSALYALSPTRRHEPYLNYREVETLGPLSKEIGIDILSNYTAKQTDQLADHVFERLASGKMCGKIAVICWKHSHIPSLAQALGWTRAPKHYPGHSFDEVWQIKYVYQPPALYNNNDNDDAIMNVEEDNSSTVVGGGAVAHNKKKQKSHDDAAGERPGDHEEATTATTSTTKSRLHDKKHGTKEAGNHHHHASSKKKKKNDKQQPLRRRKLDTPEKQQRHLATTTTSWVVYGSKQDENFDPLSFSHFSGDYPQGGKDQGGSWMMMAAAAQEEEEDL